MLELEILAVYGVFATINLAVFIAICFSHKRNSLYRVNSLKEDWFFTLPDRFADLADEMLDGNIDKNTAYTELKNISSTYDTLEYLESSYRGKGSKNVINLLSINFVILIFSALASEAALSFNEITTIIQFYGVALALMFYFFFFLYKTLNFIRKEEDLFQNVENSLSTYIEPEREINEN